MSLADKREQIIEGDWSYLEKDVKQALQEFQEIISDNPSLLWDWERIFGYELLK